MEDFMFDMFIGKGPLLITDSQLMFTLIKDYEGGKYFPEGSFWIIKRLDLYTPEELKTIIKRSSTF